MMSLCNCSEIDSSTIISLGALIISAITVFHTQKLNSVNLVSRYYEKIFDKYLINQIPRARNYMRYDRETNRLEDIGQMNDTLARMKKDSLYFQYSNKKFYDKLCELINELETLLGEYSNIAEPNREKQIENESNIGDKIENIYNHIKKYSTGK